MRVSKNISIKELLSHYAKKTPRKHLQQVERGTMYTQMCYAIIESERKRRKELTGAMIVCNTPSCGG